MEGGIKTIFNHRGYVAAVRVFSQRECRSMLTRLQQNQQRPPTDWHKGWAVASPEFYALARHDQVMEMVTSLIGTDVLLWGASVVVRKPDQAHPWHTDIETSAPAGQTLAVWIGLANTDAHSSLKVVPFSHRFGVTLQQILQEKSKERACVTDADVARWATDRESRSGVVSLDTRDGEMVLFDGRLWHGSHNENKDKTRYAVLLQYTTPETAIRIPNPGRVTWPFEMYQSPRPPCILLSGHTMNDVNRIVPAPVAKSDDGLPSLSSRIRVLQLPLEGDPKAGWKPHPVFQGSTPDMLKMGCHVSVLDPDRQPHPPHRHEEEEILMILDGEADLVVEDGQQAGETSRHRVQRGSFAYYPTGFAHTIHNPSNAPVTYLMFKWKTDRKKWGDFLRQQFVSFSEGCAAMPGPASNGFATKRVLDGETECLRHLHAHITSVQPGASYAPHIDAYDVGIVLLEGTVETLGQRVGPYGVIFYSAGESHGMENVGDVPAVYMVFEFHGRHCNTDCQYDPRFSRRLAAVLRDPERLSLAVKRRARRLLNGVRRCLRSGADRLM